MTETECHACGRDVSTFEVYRMHSIDVCAWCVQDMKRDDDDR